MGDLKFAVGKIDTPLYVCMTYAVRLSRKLLDSIKKHVLLIGSLFFHEAMFISLVMKHGLSVLVPPQLHTIKWISDYTDSEIIANPDNVFHPVKRMAPLIEKRN